MSDGSLWEVSDAHRHGKLNLSAVPEAERAVIRKVTHLQWDQRFDSCLELVEAMRDALRAEGDTKPSFLPPDAGSGRDGQSPWNVVDPANGSLREQAAPAALQTADSVENQSFGSSNAEIETAYFEVAETSTRKQGFANETLPALAENSGARSAAASLEAPSRRADSLRAKQVIAIAWREAILANRWLASAAAGALILVIGFAVWQLTQTDKSSPNELDRDLLTEAFALWDQDESEAVRLFQHALETEQPPTL